MLQIPLANPRREQEVFPRSERQISADKDLEDGEGRRIILQSMGESSWLRLGRVPHYLA